MPKRPANYYRPESLSQALQLLAQPAAVPLAGGTRLLAEKTDHSVVDLQALGLNQAEWIEGEVQLGATITLTDLAEAVANTDEEQGPSALMRHAIRFAGPNTYRNAATLGGVIASRLADSELLATLLVLEAELTMYTPDPTKITLATYLTAAERPVGLITQIRFPWAKGNGFSQRVARTPADTPIVSVTYWQPTDGRPRLAATGINIRPVRLTEAEAVLARDLNSQTIAAAGMAAKQASRHPGDFRGDASYRAAMAEVLTKRVCQLASGSPARSG